MGPSRARISASFPLVKPWREEKKKKNADPVTAQISQPDVTGVQGRTRSAAVSLARRARMLIHRHASKSKGGAVEVGGGARSCLATRRQQKTRAIAERRTGGEMMRRMGSYEIRARVGVGGVDS